VGKMGIGELAIVLAILVLLFGAKRLPQLADGMGKAIRNFKRGLNTDDENVTPAQKQVTETSSATELEGAEKSASENKA
jgi:sec-independent protein translocase protein TatA